MFRLNFETVLKQQTAKPGKLIATKSYWLTIIIFDKPDKFPDIAASSVDTWKSLKASSTSTFVANGDNLILANDSEILIMASNCLK